MKRILTIYTSDLRIQASCKITVLPLTAVNNLIILNSVHIYPNPLKGKQLNIDFGNFTESTTIKVVDTNGFTLMEEVAENQNPFQIDLDLKSGIYLVQLINK